MKITAQQFKDIVCVVNRVCRENTLVSFIGSTWIGKSCKGDSFYDCEFKEIKSLEVIFTDDGSHEHDEIIIKMK